jgi:hypothetical protein
LTLLLAHGGCSSKCGTPSVEQQPRRSIAKKEFAPTRRQAVEIQGAKINVQWRDSAGQPMLEVSANSLKGKEVGQKVVLQKALCRLYQDGKLSAVMTAPRIEADGEKRTLAASGGVLVKASDGESYAKSRSAVWDADHRIIRGKGNVLVKWRGAELTGDEFTADTELGRIKIISKSNGKGRLR